MSALRIATVAVLAAGLGLAAPARAQTITANPASVTAFLKSEGLSVTEGTENGGAMLDSGFGDDAKFSVYFFNCDDNHKNCTTVQFYAGYTGSKADAAKLNTWNRTRRFGRAYIDTSGDPVVEMDVDLAAGGMSRALFKDNFDFWKELMDLFSAFVFED